MNNEMIERIIKASFDCWKGDKGNPDLTVDDLGSDEYEFAVAHAKAIVKAMREPTDNMIRSAIGASADNKCWCEADTLRWQAMIDSITND